MQRSLHIEMNRSVDFGQLKTRVKMRWRHCARITRARFVSLKLMSLLATAMSVMLRRVPQHNTRVRFRSTARSWIKWNECLPKHEAIMRRSTQH